MSMGRTMKSTLEGPLNTISSNKDATQCVVAGRNVFKIFTIEDEEFVEKLNLRVGKMNLNFSCTDVVWNPVEDHILASAATNGAVVTWNLNRSSKNLVFAEHKRTVNKVSFHPTEAHLLLSGSLDGTMILFDLRKKESCSVFHAGQDCVRDVQFNPHHYFQFSATHDNVVDLWDMRRTDKCERQFTAHNGPVFNCDWHPEEKRLIATAGRDKTIKVWDIQFAKPLLESCIQTIASVARIKWRPQRKYHIASCSQVVDFSINIWDVRRPYIPFAAFNEHKDVTTGIAWRHDPHIFLSVSKDFSLYQHVFRDATRPADSAAPVGLAVNVFGDITHAISDKLETTSSVRSSGNFASTKPSFFRRPPSRSELFKSASSNLNVFQNAGTNNLSMDGFVILAKKYLLNGKPLEELCEHNASMAANIAYRYDVAQSWNMLKLLYAADVSQTLIRTHTLDSTVERVPPDKGKQRLENTEHDADKTAKPKQTAADGDQGAGSDSDWDVSDSEHERQLSNIASGLANTHGDFFFGDGEDEVGYDYETTSLLDMGKHRPDWTLANEAFQPKHEINERSAPPVEHLNGSPSSMLEEAELSDTIQCATNTDTKPDALLTTVVEHQSPWESTQLVVNMLHHYAEKGDVQMSVSVLIVLGDRIRPYIPDQTQEQWFMSYIDLLGRFQLWSCANEIIKWCNHPAVSVLNQQSTSVHTNCNRCGKVLQRSGWLCDRCKLLTNSCSICHLTVRGMYAWCQGCAHGGHLQHMQEWFGRHQMCPAGCGHQCELSS